MLRCNSEYNTDFFSFLAPLIILFPVSDSLLLRDCHVILRGRSCNQPSMKRRFLASLWFYQTLFVKNNFFPFKRYFYIKITLTCRMLLLHLLSWFACCGVAVCVMLLSRRRPRVSSDFTIRRQPPSETKCTFLFTVAIYLFNSVLIKSNFYVLLPTNATPVVSLETF